MSKYRATAVNTDSFITWPLVIAAVFAVVMFDLHDSHMPVWVVIVSVVIYILGSAIRGAHGNEAVLVERDD